MIKVYLIYAKIPALLFDCKLYEFIKDDSKYKLSDGYYIGLYAWTTSKLLLDAFLDFRKGANKIYKIKKHEFTKNEFKYFKSDNISEELVYQKIPYENGIDASYDSYEGWIPSKNDTKKDIEKFFNSPSDSAKIVCTREEYNTLYEHGPRYLCDYLAQIITAEYLVFKDEYKMALDYIGYCDNFNLIHDEPEDQFYFDRAQMTEFNKSYDMSYYGNKPIDLYENKVALFINIYYEMIVGYDSNEEIKLLVYK